MSMTRPTTEQITHKGQLLSTRLDETFNLKDFGAVGDGVTDDMDALIAAVNAVKAAGGGTLYIPVTANGYYLRRGAGCELGGTSNISIISNGATFKLQGGTYSQAVVAVFSANSLLGGATNLRISGLRFVSASTVLRYGNGLTSPRHFEDEVDLGRADPNEQSSFRFVMNLQGALRDLTIDNCYFGPDLYNPIRITNGGLAGVIVRKVQLLDLVFEGISSQCIYMNSVKDCVINNITSLDHKGSKFDWTFYWDAGIENLTVSNVCIKNSVYTPGFGCSAVGFDGGTVNGTISSMTIENIGMNTFVLASTNVVISGLAIRSCGGTGNGGMSIGASSNNVSITGLVIADCGWSLIANGGTNISISDFVFRNASRQAFGDGTSALTNWTLSDGQIIDCGATVAATVRLVNSTVSRRVKFDNVDFIYSTYVPTLESVDVRGANTVVQFNNCTWRSEFGTGTTQPLYAGNSARIELDSCTKSGYSVGLTYTGAAGAGVVTRVPELPGLEATLTANSTTPSVLDNTLFVTANTSATAYTNFTDGVQGQDICIRVNDANTTFDFSGTNLKGRNGVDYTATSGDMVFAKRIGSNWFCTVIEA